MTNKRGDYKSCFIWVGLVDAKIGQPPMFPLSRLIREGTVGDCPHCQSTTEYDKLFGFITKYFGAKKYCLNKDCIYYYFDVRTDDTPIKNKTHLQQFVTSRIRESKLERVLKKRILKKRI